MPAVIDMAGTAGDNPCVKTLLPSLLLLAGCGPDEPSFPTSTGGVNANWNDDEDAPDPYDTGPDDDDNGNNGGNNGGGDNGGSNGGDGSGSGGDLYLQHCVECHGQDGEGSGNAPTLAGEIDTLTDSELEDIVQNGTGDMPSPGLTASEAETLVDWLRNAWQ